MIPAARPLSKAEEKLQKMQQLALHHKIDVFSCVVVLLGPPTVE